MTTHHTSNAASPATPAAIADVVRTTARAFERDRYLSALLSPRGAQADLIALAAFAGEVARTSSYVSEPAIGEIRLQWWREATDTFAQTSGADEPSGGRSHDAITANPIADALARAVNRNRLPVQLLHDVIEAESALLYAAQPFSDWPSLADNLATTHASLFELAWRVLTAGPPRTHPETQSDVHYNAQPPEMIVQAAQAYGLARTLIEVPAVLAQGRARLPAELLKARGFSLEAVRTGERPPGLADVMREGVQRATAHLERVRQGWRTAPRALRLAIAPVALVQPYLRVCERSTDSPLGSIDVTPLTRVWQLWRAVRLGRP